MASAGTVTVDFAAETARFTAELKKVNDKLGGMQSSFKSLESVAKGALGFLSVRAFGSFIKSSLDAADALGDVADRIGVSVKALSRLQFAAQESDVDIEVLNKSLERMSINISDAFRGVGAAKNSLDALGLSASDLRGLGLDQQLGRIADQFQKIQDPADRVRIATDLFGKAGAQLVPLLAKGSAGLREFAAEADRLGISLDEHAVKSIDRANKALDRFWLIAKRGTANVVGTLIADVFGSGDELADAEARLGSLLRIRQQVIDHGTGSTGRIDAQIKEQQSEVNLLRFQEFRLQAQKDLTDEKLRTADASLQEVQASGQRVRVAGSPENFDELAQDFADQARETEISSQSDFYDAMRTMQSDFSATTFSLSSSRVSEQLKIEDDGRIQAAANADFWREYEEKAEQQKQNNLLRIKQEGLNAGQALLTAYGGKYKKFAQALLVFEKAKAIANIITDTQVAASSALETYGYPFGLAAAAGAIAFGAARIAVVASTFIGGNSAPSLGGSTAAPVFTSNADTSFNNNDERATAQSQRVTQVVFNGPIYNTDDFQRSIVDALKDVSDRDVIVFASNSAQAQAIRAAA